MKIAMVSVAAASLFILAQPALLAQDVTLGHVSLPKGKYVLTNAESSATIVIHVDEDGLVKGPKLPGVASTAAPATGAASATSTAPAAAATPAAAVPGKSSALTNMVMQQAKSQAVKALTNGQVKGLMNKSGVNKLLK